MYEVNKRADDFVTRREIKKYRFMQMSIKSVELLVLEI